MKYALVFAFAALGCAGTEPVTVTPAQPAAPPAEVQLAARPAPQPAPQPQAAAKPAEAPPPAPAPAPEEEKEGAQFGMIGLINPGASGDPNAGNMWGADVGDSFGAGGLGLRGGGTGEGTIGLGSIGTLGHGTGKGQGFGSGQGRLGGTNRKPPKIEIGAQQVSGRLPPEVIRRIVRQNFGRYRLCYENGLRNNPKLAGKVVVKFVIGRDGAVTSASNVGSTMPDAGVVSCVARAFLGLTFPQPEGGVVVVTYPLDMSPPDAAPQPPPPAPPPPTQTGTKAQDTTAAPKR